MVRSSPLNARSYPICEETLSSTEQVSAEDASVLKKVETGFPRKMDQALKFDESVCPSKFTLFLDCPEETMMERLLNRGKTSGRADDNAESIKKRFKTFVETSMPVVEYFEGKGKVVRVSASKPAERVYEDVKMAMKARGFEMKSPID